MSKLTTNLRASPYFSSFDQAKQYYRILFKPSTAIQTQELQGVFDILQDQIDKFARNIYKEGSIVEGCEFSYDGSSLYYLKIADSYVNSVSLNPTNFVNNYVYGAYGLKALVISASLGAVSSAPNTNTLYVKYLNKGTYGNGALQTNYDMGEQIRIATVANATIGNTTIATNAVVANVGAPVGRCYAMHVNEGVIFHKGTLVYVLPQTVVVSKYDNVPNNVSVGFGSTEVIVSAEVDPDLYDNADGSPNYAAPGADRLKIVPELIIKDTNEAANDSSFFSLADFKDGLVVKQKQDEQLSTLGIELARRMYETNGNFVVKPFLLSTTPISNTSNTMHTTHVNLNVDRGLGYVEGYRVEYLNRDSIPLRKATDYNSIDQQVVSANFGYYAEVKELSGTFLSSNSIVRVELHNVAKTAVTSETRLSTSYSSATRIGYAYVRGMSSSVLSSNTAASTYNIYLFDVQMSAGQNFKDVKSIINYSGSLLGVADVVLTYNYTANANVAQIQEPTINGLVYPFGQAAIKPDGFNNTQYVYRTKSSTSFLANGSASISIGAAVGSGTEGFPYLGTLDSSQRQDFIIVPTAQGLSSNQTGNVAVTSGGNTVTGTGTSFLSSYAVGDYLAVYTSGTPEVKLISGIINNTSMSVKSNFTTSNTSTNHALGFPIGMPIPLTTRSNRAVTVTSSTAARIDLGVTTQGTFNVDAIYNIQRSSTVPSTKTIKRNIFVKIDCSNNTATQYGPWCLGLPDVFALEGVFVDSSSYSNTTTNLVDSFTLDTGQRDSHYGLAYLVPKKNITTSSSKILVQLSHFTHDTSQGVGFFTANSYPIDDANTANTNAIQTAQIPTYTTTKGTVFDLRDCVDYRARAANTAVSSNSVGGASINPASTVSYSDNPYFPAPDTSFETDLEYYLPRVDRAALDIAGNLLVDEGLPRAVNPSPPAEKAGTMTLGIIKVPPYPSLSAVEAKSYNRYDYAIQNKILQNRRYTMKDIKTLDDRITNVEYYTSLTLLEVAASQLLVRNDSTGQNRFRNGIFVDPFNGFDISNTIDKNFDIAIDSSRSELRPKFLQKRTDLDLDTGASTGVVKKGELVMLTHTANNLYISQPAASKYRNCIDGNVFEWKGIVTLNPPGTLAPDLSHSPDVVNNIDLAQNWINLGQSAWGTSWGNWVDTSTSSSLSTSTNEVTNADGSKNITTTTQTTTATNQSRNGQQLNVTTDQNAYNLGTFVTNISILPYLKPTTIQFTAHGLKPNTRIYAFFNSMEVSAYCAPMTDDTFDDTPVYGDSLVTDANGDLYGLFYLPPNTFKATECVFLLTDISDLLQGESAITTSAQATFYGSKLAFSTASSILNTREAVLNIHELTEQRTLIGSNTTSSTQYVPAPYVPPTYYYTDYSLSSGGGDGSGGGASGGDCGCGDAGGE